MIQKLNDMVTLRGARWFGTIVVILTVLATGYFTVSALVDPGGLVPGGDGAAARTYAAYMAARNLVLAGSMLWLLAARSWRALALLLAINGLVQIADAVIGGVKHQIPQTLGPAAFAVALLLAAGLLGAARGVRW